MKYGTTLVLTVICAIVPFTWASAGEETRGFLPRTHKSDGGESKYTVFVPSEYDGEKEFPLILFLHGSGERGEDGQAQTKVGLGKAIRKYKGGANKFPFIAVFPQCKPGTNWSAGSAGGKNALAILEEVRKDYKIDGNRVYLTGLSLGGFGTWSLATAHPEMWAAIVPICGGGNPANADKIKDIPCWCFHGTADKNVPVQKSRDMIEALKKAGAMPK
jgi:predicted peptidase